MASLNKLYRSPHLIGCQLASASSYKHKRQRLVSVGRFHRKTVKETTLSGLVKYLSGTKRFLGDTCHPVVKSFASMLLHE